MPVVRTLPLHLIWLLGVLVGSLPAQQPPAGAGAVSPMFTERAERREAYRHGKVQAAVRDGIGWLLEHQDEKGFWDCDEFMKRDPAGQQCDGAGNPAQDVGVTALALLALLAQADGVHDGAVHRAAGWLVSQQHEQSGRFHSEAHDFVYAQAIATLALIEAAALHGNAEYRRAAANGLRCLEQHHNPGAAWRYGCRDGDNDTSVTSWCVAAYCAARHAGFDVSAESVGEALAWLESVTQVENGHCGYSRRIELSGRTSGDHAERFPVEFGEAMTAAGMSIRTKAGLSPGGRLHRAAARGLLVRLPSWEARKIDFYYWHHATEAMAAFPVKNERTKWMTALHRALLPRQRKDGPFRGSWDPVGAWSEPGGRVYSTALNVLTLSSPYRSAHGDGDAIVPDEPPFAAVHSHWAKDEIGAAICALDAIAVEDLTAAQRAIECRVRWFATVQTHFAAQVALRAEEAYPEFLARHSRLEEFATIYDGIPAGRAAKHIVASLEGNPEFGPEIASQRVLREILDRFDREDPPSARSRRRALVRAFQQLVDAYPDTPAAGNARWWIKRLR